MNNKGNVVVIIVLMVLIGLIVYFGLYAQMDNNSSNMSNVSYSQQKNDSNSYKVLTNNLDSNIKTKATIIGFRKLDVKDINTVINGNVKVECQNATFTMTDPKINIHSATISVEDNTINGSTNFISSKDTTIDFSCQFKIASFDSLTVQNQSINIEESNVSGDILVQDIHRDLSKAYLKISNYKGDITVTKKGIDIDGLSSVVEITQNNTNIVVK